MSFAVVAFVRTSPNARAPLVASEKAAGADLYASEHCVVPAGERRLVPTGLCVAIPEGYYGHIAPRSGLALRNFIDCGAGIIDADYRGEIYVLLFNFGKQDFMVNVGDRVAQLICEKIGHPILKEVTALPESKRGTAGFGSTGLK